MARHQLPISDPVVRNRVRCRAQLGTRRAELNKVNSKVQLRWKPADPPSIPEEVRFRVLTKLEPQLTDEGDLLVMSQLYRDQPRNREDCLEKLREIIRASLIVPKVRKKSKPSRAAKARRLKDKRLGSEKKTQRRSPKLDE